MSNAIISHIRNESEHGAPGAYTLGICRQIERALRRSCAMVRRVPPPRVYLAQPAPPMRAAAYASRVAALVRARAALAEKVARAHVPAQA